MIANTPTINSANETFQLNVTDRFTGNDEHVTPYSITNMIQINVAPEPASELINISFSQYPLKLYCPE